MPYYEVKSKELASKVSEWMQEASLASKERYRFSRRVGANRRKVISFAGIGRGSFGLIFTKPPDEKAWKRLESGGVEYWQPRRSTKAGKGYAEEMDRINRMMPNSFDLSKLFKLESMKATKNGMSIRRPGIMRDKKKKRWLVVMPDDYKPIAGLKRISDIEWEKVLAQ